jgi:hypothetical protein
MSLCELTADLHELRSHETEAAALQARDDFPDQGALHPIRFD